MNQKNIFLKSVIPAKIYTSVNDLWVITSFFNSQNYSTKYSNYIAFIDSLEKSGINYLVIECAFKNQSFTLPSSPNVLKVRSKSILWQKERLLNIAISRLPISCTKVAWIDCDVLFENELWAVETSRLLDEYSVVQPFDSVIRLPKASSYYAGDGIRWESFASVYQKRPNQLPISEFALHGHTGFAWAIRKNIIAKHGFYDACISGSADHLMAHAFTGDFYSDCNNQILGQNSLMQQHFQEWAQAIQPEVSGKIGCVSGTALHLWHGEYINRQYLKRNQELVEYKFNPYQDILINSEGCWEWSLHDKSKLKLKELAEGYYERRKEDG